MRILLVFFLLSLPALAQDATTGLPSPQLYGTGAPTKTCSAANLSGVSYVQTDATNGRLWTCDPVVGWIHFVTPFIGTGTSGLITPPTVVGCVSGTASVPGAATTMAATASPIGSPGTGQINSTAYVSSAGVVTITLCLPLTLVYTANAVAYKVLVY